MFGILTDIDRMQINEFIYYVLTETKEAACKKNVETSI